MNQNDNSASHSCPLQLNTLGCINDAPLLHIYITNIAWSSANALIGLAVLFYGVFKKKLPIFGSRAACSIRPRPIESMLLFGSIYNMLKAIAQVLTITNSYPDPIFKSFFENLPWQFCYYSFACYLFGVAHTVCNSKEIIGDKHRTLPVIIDIFFIMFTIFPFVITNTCSIAIGALNKQGNLGTSKYTDALNYSWLLYSAILALWIPYAGYLLIKVLKQQIAKNENRPAFVQNVKAAMFKILMTMLIAIATLMTSIIFEVLTILKVNTSQNYHLTLAMYIINAFNSTLASTLVILAILFNPKLLTPFGLPSPSREESAEHTMGLDSGTGMQKGP